MRLDWYWLNSSIKNHFIRLFHSRFFFSMSSKLSNSPMWNEKEMKFDDRICSFFLALNFIFFVPIKSTWSERCGCIGLFFFPISSVLCYHFENRLAEVSLLCMLKFKKNRLVFAETFNQSLSSAKYKTSESIHCWMNSI